MTIAELIEILSKLDNTLLVYTYDGEYGSYNSINKIETEVIDNEVIVALY